MTLSAYLEVQCAPCSVRCILLFLVSVTPPLGADGELHPTCGHHQRRLHGVSLPRRKALGLPFHPEPLWHWKLEGTRWVSVKLQSSTWVQKS